MRLASGSCEAQSSDTMSNPTKVLTQGERKDYLRIIEITLNNLDFASLMANVVHVYLRENLPLPKADVRFEGKHHFAMGSANCGVVAFPVLQIAALDCRRSLEFFGLRFDRKKNPPVLVQRQDRKADDIGIEHFELPPVTPGEFFRVTNLHESTLERVDEWASKQLAHFTTVDPKIVPGLIEHVAPGIVEAFRVLLYVALGEPWPKMLLERREK